MITLAIDTSTPHGSVALLDKEVTFERGELFVALAKLDPGNVDQIVVGVGPGSFTGIRAGIAAAKGLALPRAVPVLPAMSFDAIARTALPALPRDCPQMCVLCDARRDEVYFAIYDRQGHRTGDCRIGPLEAIEMHNPIWFVSPEIEKYRLVLRELFGGFATICEQPVFPRASALQPAQLPLEPMYLRTADYRKS
jgi:tRNA threonylcarbamoyl adenosine modification protein YeaZ